MELFVINRYNPDNQVQQSNEDKIKEELIEKIKKRKSSLNGHEERTENAGTNENEDSKEVQVTAKKKHGRKKKKLSQESNDMSVPKTSEAEESRTNYVILGTDPLAEKTKIKRVLPYWLKHPSVVSVDLKNLSHGVNCIPDLDEKLVALLNINNISHFFPVQQQVIPWLLTCLKRPSTYWPSDVCVSAPTGSGKTLAFVLPIVQSLQNSLSSCIQALIVLPVLDLAKQVHKVFKTYAEPLGVKTILLSSAQSFDMEQKQLIRKDYHGNYQSLVDVVVTTPGRLVDHIKGTPGFNMEHLRFLVIDEADRVMEDVQNNWLHHLNNQVKCQSGLTRSLPLSVATLRTIKRPPQKLLFSATLSQDPEKLQNLGLFQPKLFTSVVKTNQNTNEAMDEEVERGEFVGKFTTPAELKENYIVCQNPSLKPLILYHMIMKLKCRGVLCFTRSKQAVHRLTLLLRCLSRSQFRVSKISSDLSAIRREKILKKFSQGSLDVLVSSDALARGIDIAGVKYVISYDPPKFAKNYVHRIGRTGRAGQKGTATTILLLKEVPAFKKIMNIAGKNNIEEIIVNEEDIKGMYEAYQQTLLKVRQKLKIAQNFKNIKAKK